MVDPDTFGDDSLRVLRAVQLAARLEFDVDEPTRAVCRTIPLDDLPAERIRGELEKLLLRAARPSLGLALARDLGVVSRLFPELEALIDCPQEPEWHPEGDVWVHTLMVVDEARRRIDDLPPPQQLAVMLGAVCHDFGKPATTAFIDGRIRSRDHEEQGVAPATAFLDRLKVHTLDGYDVRGQVLGMVAHHLKPGCGIPPATASATGPSGGWRARWTWSCWPAWPSQTAWAAPAASTARRWTGSWSAHGAWASSTPRRPRCCSDAICCSLACRRVRAWAKS